jgi:class 3 adenylate cyclase
MDDSAPHAVLHGRAPSTWPQELPTQRLKELIDKQSVPMIVLSLDIRSSTVLMKEAIDFVRFAKTISAFVTSASDVFRTKRAWYDKFTGDGFLIYWILDSRPAESYYDEVLEAAKGLLTFFHERIEKELLTNSRNFPARVGVSIGVDSGPVYLVTVAGELTVVGLPVVGAVRMVDAAQPYEVVVNAQLGQKFAGAARDALRQKQFTITAEHRQSKEYSQGQLVYVLTLDSSQYAAPV